MSLALGKLPSLRKKSAILYMKFIYIIAKHNFFFYQASFSFQIHVANDKYFHIGQRFFSVLFWLCLSSFHSLLRQYFSVFCEKRHVRIRCNRFTVNKKNCLEKPSLPEITKVISNRIFTQSQHRFQSSDSFHSAMLFFYRSLRPKTIHLCHCCYALLKRRYRYITQQIRNKYAILMSLISF